MKILKLVVLSKNNTIELAFYEYIKGTPSDNWVIKEAVLYEMHKIRLIMK